MNQSDFDHDAAASAHQAAVIAWRALQLGRGDPEGVRTVLHTEALMATRIALACGGLDAGRRVDLRKLVAHPFINDTWGVSSHLGALVELQTGAPSIGHYASVGKVHHRGMAI